MHILRGRAAMASSMYPRPAAPLALLMPDSEAVLARLFDVSNEPMTVTELESGRLLSINPAFAALTGYAERELAGRRAVDVGLWIDPKLMPCSR